MKMIKKHLFIPGAGGLSLGRSTIENVHMRENYDSNIAGEWKKFVIVFF